MKTLFLSLLTAPLFFSFAAEAKSITAPKITIKTIEYKDPSDGTTLEGLVAYDEHAKGKQPGVLVIHEWTGIGPYVRGRIEQIAKLGYVAFAADIYGKGVRPSNPKDAGATSGMYKKDRNLLRRRVNLGFDELKKQAHVDTTKLAAMGYCFGGTTALELARSGAEAKGFISFHGGLDTPTPNDAKNIKGEVLVLHGAADTYVPQKDVAAFEKEMSDAHVKYTLVQYPGAVHGFTNPEHGNDPKQGLAYDKNADLKSWDAMKVFFGRVLK